jgi:hypothetical protein
MLKRRFHGERRLILGSDPAVTAGYAQYHASYYADHDALTLDGEPTVFVIRPLSRRQADVCSSFGGRAADVHTLRCGLWGVEALTIVDEGGSEQPCPAIKREQIGDLGSVITEGWLDKVQPGPFVGEIAAAIWRITEPDPT